MSVKNNLIIDASIFTAFLVISNPYLTGITIHEWLGVSFAVAIIAHLLLHWDGIVNVGRKFFKKLWHQSRLNLVVDALFFIVMTGSLFSGLWMSKNVMSSIGIQLNVSQSWKSIHTLMLDASIILLGVHVALHWKWIVSTIDRYVVNPIRGLVQRGAVSPVLTAQPLRVEKRK